MTTTTLRLSLLLGVVVVASLALGAAAREADAGAHAGAVPTDLLRSLSDEEFSTLRRLQHASSAVAVDRPVCDADLLDVLGLERARGRIADPRQFVVKALKYVATKMHMVGGAGGGDEQATKRQRAAKQQQAAKQAATTTERQTTRSSTSTATQYEQSAPAPSPSPSPQSPSPSPSPSSTMDETELKVWQWLNFVLGQLPQSVARKIVSVAEASGAELLDAATSHRYSCPFAGWTFYASWMPLVPSPHYRYVFVCVGGRFSLLLSTCMRRTRGIGADYDVVVDSADSDTSSTSNVDDAQRRRNTAAAGVLLPTDVVLRLATAVPVPPIGSLAQVGFSLPSTSTSSSTRRDTGAAGVRFRRGQHARSALRYGAYSMWNGAFNTRARAAAASASKLAAAAASGSITAPSDARRLRRSLLARASLIAHPQTYSHFIRPQLVLQGFVSGPALIVSAAAQMAKLGGVQSPLGIMCVGGLALQVNGRTKNLEQIIADKDENEWRAAVDRGYLLGFIERALYDRLSAHGTSQSLLAQPDAVAMFRRQLAPLTEWPAHRRALVANVNGMLLLNNPSPFAGSSFMLFYFHVFDAYLVVDVHTLVPVLSRKKPVRFALPPPVTAATAAGGGVDAGAEKRAAPRAAEFDESGNVVVVHNEQSDKHKNKRKDKRQESEKKKVRKKAKKQEKKQEKKAKKQEKKEKRKEQKQTNKGKGEGKGKGTKEKGKEKMERVAKKEEEKKKGKESEAGGVNVGAAATGYYGYRSEVIESGGYTTQFSARVESDMGEKNKQLAKALSDETQAKRGSRASLEMRVARMFAGGLGVIPLAAHAHLAGGVGVRTINRVRESAAPQLRRRTKPAPADVDASVRLRTYAPVVGRHRASGHRFFVERRVRDDRNDTHIRAHASVLAYTRLFGTTVHGTWVVNTSMVNSVRTRRRWLRRVFKRGAGGGGDTTSAASVPAPQPIDSRAKHSGEHRQTMLLHTRFTALLDRRQLPEAEASKTSTSDSTATRAATASKTTTSTKTTTTKTTTKKPDKSQRRHRLFFFAQQEREAKSTPSRAKRSSSKTAAHAETLDRLNRESNEFYESTLGALVRQSVSYDASLRLIESQQSEYATAATSKAGDRDERCARLNAEKRARCDDARKRIMDKVKASHCPQLKKCDEAYAARADAGDRESESFSLFAAIAREAERTYCVIGARLSCMKWATSKQASLAHRLSRAGCPMSCASATIGAKMAQVLSKSAAAVRSLFNTMLERVGRLLDIGSYWLRKLATLLPTKLPRIDALAIEVRGALMLPKSEMHVSVRGDAHVSWTTPFDERAKKHHDSQRTSTSSKHSKKNSDDVDVDVDDALSSDDEELVHRANMAVASQAPTSFSLQLVRTRERHFQLDGADDNGNNGVDDDDDDATSAAAKRLNMPKIDGALLARSLAAAIASRRARAAAAKTDDEQVSQSALHIDRRLEQLSLAMCKHGPASDVGSQQHRASASATTTTTTRAAAAAAAEAAAASTPTPQQLRQRATQQQQQQSITALLRRSTNSLVGAAVQMKVMQMQLDFNAAQSRCRAKLVQRYGTLLSDDDMLNKLAASNAAATQRQHRHAPSAHGTSASSTRLVGALPRAAPRWRSSIVAALRQHAPLRERYYAFSVRRLRALSSRLGKTVSTLKPPVAFASADLMAAFENLFVGRTPAVRSRVLAHLVARARELSKLDVHSDALNDYFSKRFDWSRSWWRQESAALVTTGVDSAVAQQAAAATRRESVPVYLRYQLAATLSNVRRTQLRWLMHARYTANDKRNEQMSRERERSLMSLVRTELDERTWHTSAPARSLGVYAASTLVPSFLPLCTHAYQRVVSMNARFRAHANSAADNSALCTKSSSSSSSSSSPLSCTDTRVQQQLARAKQAKVVRLAYLDYIAWLAQGEAAERRARAFDNLLLQLRLVHALRTHASRFKHAWWADQKLARGAANGNARDKPSVHNVDVVSPTSLLRLWEFLRQQSLSFLGDQDFDLVEHWFNVLRDDDSAQLRIPKATPPLLRPTQPQQQQHAYTTRSNKPAAVRVSLDLRVAKLSLDSLAFGHVSLSSLMLPPSLSSSSSLPLSSLSFAQRESVAQYERSVLDLRLIYRQIMFVGNDERYGNSPITARATGRASAGYLRVGSLLPPLSPARRERDEARQRALWRLDEMPSLSDYADVVRTSLTGREQASIDGVATHVRAEQVGESELLAHARLLLRTYTALATDELLAYVVGLELDDRESVASRSLLAEQRAELEAQQRRVFVDAGGSEHEWRREKQKLARERGSMLRLPSEGLWKRWASGAFVDELNQWRARLRAQADATRW